MRSAMKLEFALAKMGLRSDLESGVVLGIGLNMSRQSGSTISRI